MSWFDRGERRRRRLEAAFARGVPAGKQWEQAASDYRDLLLDALRAGNGALALSLFREYDGRFPAERHAAAFNARDEGLLADFTSSSEPDVLGVILELATRLGLASVRREARGRLADLQGERGDADRLVALLGRWQRDGFLDRETVTRALRGHLTRSSLGRDAQLWTAFFTSLPETSVPDLFAVHVLLDHGARAVRVSETPAQRGEALACCLRSPRLDDVRAGMDLARREGDPRLAALEEHAADLLFEAGDHTEALGLYQRVGRQDRVSECHERLGRPDLALACCPAGLPDRLDRLAGACWLEVDALVEASEYGEAARKARQVVTRLRDEPGTDERIRRRKAEAAARRRAVAVMARRHYEGLLASAEPGGESGIYGVWSRFEETIGEPFAAAERAEQGGDLYRAHTLYLEANRPGDAERVLRGEPSSWRERAAAREAGGDLLGAAALHEEAGELEEATALYLRADRPSDAARCLVARLGDGAIEDPRLAGCLRRTGDHEGLVGLALRGVERLGRHSKGFDVLRSLRAESTVPPHLEDAVVQRLDALGAQDRGRFEQRAENWLVRARSEIDKRYARIWALDLGTTTCAVAVYDSETGQAVLCPWKGRPFFASTLTIDENGTERVGLAGEELLAGWVKGVISAAKRRIGRSTRYRIRGRDYRTEEVAARLITHARELVETFLADRVLERVGELARDELGETRAEWLEWLAGEHETRIIRDRAVLTIPAFFRNNQKQATRNACEIARVDLVRLIHEPTAACVSAARQRRLTGDVVVVDLGAGTLDISALNVEDDIYEVLRVTGDNEFGGKDFDAVIGEALERRLARAGVEVPAKGKERLRFEIAVEHLKIALSSQPHAVYPLPGFNGDPSFQLELDRDELTEILAEPLRKLRRACTRLKNALDGRPSHLVLVGGPMLAPQVAGAVEDVFGLRRTVLADPRTAVASGAALQGAVLCGLLKDRVLLDVTPLALGIRVDSEEGEPSFSELIAANTTIPVQRTGLYTTTRDDQSEVLIQIYNEDLLPESKIAEFRLDGIPPAPRGEPQIEVAFSIDASCVLEVTAKDQKTGKRQSISIADTTLLSPDTIREMAERHRAYLAWEARQRESADHRDELTELCEEAARSDPEPVIGELRRLLRSHRAPRARLDAGTERILAELYGQGLTDLETELLSLRGPLRDLTAKTEQHLASEEPDLESARHLLARLGGLLETLRPGLAQLRLWTAVLVRLAAADTDPIRRFRHHHDTGDYTRALEALDELPDPPAGRDDVERWLRCLAETGAADAYRRTLSDHAELLGTTVPDPGRLETFTTRTRTALVRVAGAAGFLITERLVLADRSVLTGRTAHELEVETETGRHRVGHAFVPDTAHLRVVALQLDEPSAAPPLRLGHPCLVRIGDPAYAFSPSRNALRPTVVDAFESFPEHGLRLLRAGLATEGNESGGPLFNALGEVVGVLTGSGRPGEVAFAVTVDALAPLLAAAGYGMPTS